MGTRGAIVKHRLPFHKMEMLSGYSKRPIFLTHPIPPRPGRAFPGKATTSEAPRRTSEYVEGKSDVKTKLGERRVSARRGGRVRMSGLFQYPQK
jgi:hypothetical protein